MGAYIMDVIDDEVIVNVVTENTQSDSAEPLTWGGLQALSWQDFANLRWGDF